jgi:acetyltransferase-like isoleucine patch superfamily enzyme
MSTPTVRHADIRDVSFGDRVTIVAPVNLYSCSIGDDVFVGPFVEIQKGARIGARTRVQSHAFICELVSMGSDCFISHGAMFINDLIRDGKPARDDPSLWKSTTLGNRVIVGTNATVLPVSICDDVVIGAGSVVAADILEPGVYAGNPARKLRPINRKP